jgi:hypothetical protein
LWGKGVDIDSDGNSQYPESTNWNELTLILRSDISQRVDIDPIEDGKLKIKSEDHDLLVKVSSYLRDCEAVK